MEEKKALRDKFLYYKGKNRRIEIASYLYTDTSELAGFIIVSKRLVGDWKDRVIAKQKMQLSVESFFLVHQLIDKKGV